MTISNNLHSYNMVILIAGIVLPIIIYNIIILMTSNRKIQQMQKAHKLILEGHKKTKEGHKVR